MCLVIDTNVLASVFQSTSVNHQEYKPVLDWIMNGPGRVVFGGSKYKAEIGKYMRLFIELKNVNKAIQADQEKTDKMADYASSKIVHKDFDDPHIVGLLMVSGCKLVCSNDSRAFPFFTHKLFFPRDRLRPRIYSGKRNHKLLTDRNIASVCKPDSILTNNQRYLFENIINQVKK